MKKNKIMLLIFTALLIVVAVFIGKNHIGKNMLSISVVISSEAGEETVSCWKKDEENYYIFLPSYADLSQSRIDLNTTCEISMEGEKLADGMSCGIFQLNTPYDISYTVWGQKRWGKLTFMKSDQVASMYIDTESGNMDYIHEEKGNAEAGEIRLYTSEGALNYTGILDSIKGRGNNTWSSYDKKPYSVKLTEDADLLGMGKAQKWILLANADDPSNLRNKIVYDFADQVGLAYSPDSQWVDLYLNREYAGLYLLCERNEVHPERVAIAENDDSFLVSMEMESRLKAQNYPYLLTAEKLALRIHYPEKISEQKIEDLTQVWQSVENAILAEDGIDPNTGKPWQDLMDVESWAKKYLIEEIFANSDACCISQYFYYDSSDSEKKIFAGPAWDYDHTMGYTSAWEFQNPMAFYANRRKASERHDTPWFYSLYHKKEFYQRVIQLYQMELLPVLKEMLSNNIDDYSAQILQASLMNQIRWNMEEDLLTQVISIRDFLEDRIAFFNSVWIDEKVYFQVRADEGDGKFYAYFAVAPGECLEGLPDLEDNEYQNFLGWYYEDTDEPFDITQPIYADMNIYAKWEDNSSQKWKSMGKMLPIGILAMMGVLLLIVDIKRTRKTVWGYKGKDKSRCLK